MYERNHIYVMGYWIGQFQALMHAQHMLNAHRMLLFDDQEAQLEFDRLQTELDQRIEAAETALFEIPRSN